MRLCTSPQTLLLGLALLTVCARGGELEEVIGYDWGPIAYRVKDVHTNKVEKALGPFLQWRETPSGADFSAFHPIKSSWGRPGERSVRRHDFVYPFASASSSETMSKWRILLAYKWDWDTTDPMSRSRFWLMPFIWSGRSSDGQAYFALWPFAGTIREALFKDQIDFFMWPIYTQSSVRYEKSRSFVWPLINFTESPTASRKRFFPFYGQYDVYGKGTKKFVLWPFWNQVEYTDPRNPGHAWILFPITGHAKLQNQESWWAIPPLFRWTKREDEEKILGPWPFYQSHKGPEKQQIYVWPIYGTKQHGNVSRTFWLWPIAWHIKSEQPDLIKTRRLLVPFYQNATKHQTVMVNGQKEKGALKEHYTKIWPLYSMDKKEHRSLFKFPDLNPTRIEGIERNWSPLWTLYQRERRYDDVDTEILWGMYRNVKRDGGKRLNYTSIFPLADWSREKDGKHWSLLKGLIGYRRVGEKRRYQFLYFIKLGDKPD